jgi:hypothetical protein
MISSTEFQQKLRSGQIHEALALVVQETIELEITTRMTEDLESSEADNGKYLRTKINLLTGNIQNEVGKSIVANQNFPQLQQLHIEQLIVSQRLVQGYLEQIQAILAILPTAPMASDDRELNNQSGDPKIEVKEQVSLPLVSSIEPSSDLDEDLDLSIDRDGEVWEEWVEDEDFISRSDLLAPSIIASKLPLPEPSAGWRSRALDPISIKPIVPRVATSPINPTTRWEKFEPECMEPRSKIQPLVKHYPDPQQMDKILADLDI